jgi:tRNA A-37 threonylcarbamoyl transferase component Bud32/Leucine-rich repeat (LRR) protein
MSERAIFLAALDRDPAERAAFLDEACAGNETLRRGVETLLRLHAAPQQFLEVSAVEQLAAAVPGPEGAAADLSFLVPSSEPGSLGRLDHYEILEVVGKGGTGVVLRARDTKLLRVVAVKVLAAPLAASGTARQRFAREARAAAAVRDDHVVAIHAVRDDAPAPYLVMEFIDGSNLEALLRQGGPLAVPEVLRIGMQVARGLAAAHAQRLIHRDVKPANILLENGVQRVKLTDFGLARAADDASLTQSGYIAGTPLYMAPEQAAGEPLDARADLFSLGSVLYEMCTGRPAFQAPTTMAVIRRVCDEESRPIRELYPDVPEPLCRLIDRLHGKKPADRPASATGVADLLAGLLADWNGERACAPGGTLQHRGRARRARPSRRPWLWAAAAGGLLFAGLGLGEATGVTDVRGTVIRLFSPEGTLVVEVDDPGVSVAVDGADVVITGAGAKEIRLKPGQYKVEASKDGKLVRQELVTVARNGRRVVRISKEIDALTEAELWERSVAALSAEKQVEAIARRLKERNPGFDGEIRPSIEGGAVRELGFSTDDVADISPLRALKKLNKIGCGGTRDNSGRLVDLSPLRGLSLEHLQCANTRVADLTPLRGMPLRTLQFPHTLVSDLTPLKGMPLAQLMCSYTRVSDLSPLRGMKLRSLDVEGLPVTDLSPLQGMPLGWLTLYRSTAVSDLSPLRGMPLGYLNLTRLPVSDLSPLQGMASLRTLVLQETLVSDLAPILDLTVEALDIRGTRVTDIAPLKKLPLKLFLLDYRAERDAKLLRSLTGLEKINDKPAAQFWKEVGEK